MPDLYENCKSRLKDLERNEKLKVFQSKSVLKFIKSTEKQLSGM